jgi:poly-gamma-glutamate synthesis protein (capsule biosynthesis protein)
VRRTIEGVRAAGLKNSGSQYEGEDNFLIISVGAIQAGVVSYTYESPRINNVRTLNGLRITDELLPMVNSFGYEDLEGDLGEVEDAVKSARAAGADIIICYFHWGNEYQRAPDDNQRRIAARAAAAGADIIFASHPHVLQALEAIDAGGGREVPVFYSMGNFISNQRVETTGSMYTEQGMLAMVRLEYMAGSRRIVSVEAGLTPTWLDKYSVGGKNVYAIVPLDGDYKENGALLESGHVERAAAALEYCEGLFGPEKLRWPRGGEIDGAQGQSQGAGGNDGSQQQQQQQPQQQQQQRSRQIQ